MPEIKSAPPVPVLGFLTSCSRRHPCRIAAMARSKRQVSAFLPVYALRAGLSPETGALFVTLFALGNVIFQFPVGIASDQMDRRKLLLSLASSWALSGPSPWHLRGRRIFLSFVSCSSYGAASSAVFTPSGSRISVRAIAGRIWQAPMRPSLCSTRSACSGGPPIAGLGMDLVSPNGFFFSIAGLLCALSLSRLRACASAGALGEKVVPSGAALIAQASSIAITARPALWSATHNPLIVSPPTAAPREHH